MISVFESSEEYPIKRTGSATAYHATLQDSLDAAASGDTILALEYIFVEPQGVTLGKVTAKTITIKGGFLSDYVNRATENSFTTVRGR